MYEQAQGQRRAQQASAGPDMSEQEQEQEALELLMMW